MVQFDSAQLVLGPYDSFYRRLSFGLILPVSKPNREELRELLNAKRLDGNSKASREGRVLLLWTFGRYIENTRQNSVRVFGYHKRHNLDNRRVEKEGWAHFKEALRGCVEVEVTAVTVL